MSADNKSSDVASDQFVNQSCFDFLLIELVPMAYRLAEEAALVEASAISEGGATKPSTNDEDGETRQAVFYRLETLGYRVGLGLVEKFSRDKPRPTEPLDSIKFLCKDLWAVCFKKQIDNLKTNHRGVYVLTDNNFAPLRRMSVVRSDSNTGQGSGGSNAGNRNSAGSGSGAGIGPASHAGGEIESGASLALPFLYFPSGLVRGVLASLGITAVVTAEVGSIGLPSAVFQIRTTAPPK